MMTVATHRLGEFPGIECHRCGFRLPCGLLRLRRPWERDKNGSELGEASSSLRGSTHLLELATRSNYPLAPGNLPCTLHTSTSIVAKIHYRYDVDHCFQNAITRQPPRAA